MNVFIAMSARCTRIVKIVILLYLYDFLTKFKFKKFKKNIYFFKFKNILDFLMIFLVNPA